MRIGLVSDTHIPQTLHTLPSTLLDRLQGVDHILHAGDLASLSVLDDLAAIAPTTAVAGNIDPPEVGRALRDREILQLGGRTIGLQHGHQRHALQDQYIAFDYDAPEFDLFYEAMKAQLPGAEIIVFGHLHRPVIKTWQDILFINPGSVAPPHRWPTCAVLEIPIGECKNAKAEIVVL